MFISQADAEKRLASRRNKLRDEAAPEIEETVDLPETAIPEIVDIPNVPAEEEDPVDAKMLDLSRLDDLISPRPRARYKNNIPAQAAIAETSLIIGQHQAGHLFGLSQEQVLAYERGLQSTQQITTGQPSTNPELSKRLKVIKDNLAIKAAAKLGEALDLLDTPKLRQVKRATNLSKIAKDMATIVEKVTPKEGVDPGGVHFHIFKPEVNVEQNYQTVTIGAKE